MKSYLRVGLSVAVIVLVPALLLRLGCKWCHLGGEVELTKACIQLSAITISLLSVTFYVLQRILRIFLPKSNAATPSNDGRGVNSSTVQEGSSGEVQSQESNTRLPLNEGFIIFLLLTAIVYYVLTPPRGDGNNLLFASVQAFMFVLSLHLILRSSP